MVKPIGRVHRLNGDLAAIDIFSEYSLCLNRVEHFSHLIVLYWLDRVSGRLRGIARIKPRHVKAPWLGIFATRFPARPNPIGVTTVRLVERRGCRLVVEGLDAEDGTPVIDVKPYIPVFDRPRGRVKLPAWVRRHLREFHQDDHVHYSFDELLRLVEPKFRG